MKRIVLAIMLGVALLLPAESKAAPSLTKLEYNVDARGNPTTPNPSKWVNALALASGVARTITPPVGARTVVFSCTGSFYVTYNGVTAAVPSDVSDGSAPELDPDARFIYGIATMSVIAPTNCELTLSYYK